MSGSQPGAPSPARCTQRPHLLLVLLVAACGGGRAPQTPRSPSTIDAERPLTSATLRLLTDFPLATQRDRREATPLRMVPNRMFRLPGGAEAFLDSRGARAIATLSEVRHIEGPARLDEMCVSKDGKLTVALSKDTVWIAHSFDGPLQRVGRLITRAPWPATTWLVSDEKADTFLIDCEEGSVERLAASVSEARVKSWSRDVKVLELEQHDKKRSCWLRTRDTRSWRVYRECTLNERTDGSTTFYEQVSEGSSRCSFVVSKRGQLLPCSAPVERETTSSPLDTTIWPDAPEVALARYFAPSRAVIPGPKGELSLLTANGTFDENQRLPSALERCVPILATAPLFRCLAEGGRFEVVAWVDEMGRVREELRRRVPEEVRLERDDEGGDRSAFQATVGGGVAARGDCAGNPGNVACVRTANGLWHSVAFSSELVAALQRTKSRTVFLPTVEGQLYVGLDVPHLDPRDASAPDNTTVVFRADRGDAVTPPEGIRLLDEAFHRTDAWSGYGPSIGWTTPRHLRAFPVSDRAGREWVECGIDLGIDGTTDKECVPGVVFGVGRLGLLRKGPGALFETLDAGRTWTPVPLPIGTDTEDIACWALGCRVGPYFRMGWGRDAAAPAPAPPR